MRCPDCNKFVSFDSDSDPELDLEFDNDTHTVSGSVRIVNNCGECSTELKEATFDVDIDITDHVHDHWKKHGWKKGKPPDGHAEIEMSDDSGSRSDRMQTTDRHGKPIRSHRYMKHLYGAEATLTFTCECGEVIHEENWSDEIPGSGMDELV